MKSPALASLSGFFLVILFTTVHAAEEQIVIDDLSPTQLRAEIDKIQSEFYRVFNAENSDDKLDIICHDVVPTGSNRKREVCEPQFLMDKRSQNVADSRLGVDALLTAKGLQSVLTAEFRNLTEAMNALTKENQYFRELNVILGELRKRLEEISS